MARGLNFLNTFHSHIIAAQLQVHPSILIQITSADANTRTFICVSAPALAHAHSFTLKFRRLHQFTFQELFTQITKPFIGTRNHLLFFSRLVFSFFFCYFHAVIVQYKLTSQNVSEHISNSFSYRQFSQLIIECPSFSSKNNFLAIQMKRFFFEQIVIRSFKNKSQKAF